MPYVTVNGLNMYYEVHGEGAALLPHGGSGSIPEKWIPPTHAYHSSARSWRLPFQ